MKVNIFIATIGNEGFKSFLGYENNHLLASRSKMRRPRSDFSVQATVPQAKKLGIRRRRQSVVDAALEVTPVASVSTSDCALEALDSTGEDDTRFREFKFDFENLAFEGGGNKGMAYVGTIMVSR